MLKSGVVKESASPWAAPVMLIWKKNGSWSFCIDYRQLNAVTHKDAYPLPHIKESLTTLKRATWYSTLDLACNLLVYLDDVIVLSPCFDSHLCHLEQVFERLQTHRLKLQPQKCHLFRQEVCYLGHVVSQHGVATDPEKTAAVEDWPAPRTVKQMQRLLAEWEQIKIQDRLLVCWVKESDSGIEACQVLVPSGEAHKVWQEYHQASGHASSERTLAHNFTW
ncbi:hypothetical protein MHYP_G00186010 [Metynnis hypsauchen]